MLDIILGAIDVILLGILLFVSCNFEKITHYRTYKERR